MQIGEEVKHLEPVGSTRSSNGNCYHQYKSHSHFLFCFISEHKLVYFHFIQHNQHLTCTVTATLMDPILFLKALKLLPCPLQHGFNGHQIYITLSGIQEITFCFLCADLICYYYSSGVHCGPSSAHRESDTQWTLDRYLWNKRPMYEWKIKKIQVELWQTSIILWPFSTTHPFCHGFHCTWCRNTAHCLSEIKQVSFLSRTFNTATDFYHLARQICFLPLLDSHIVPGVSDLWLLFCWCGNVHGLVIQSSSKLKEPSLESFWFLSLLRLILPSGWLIFLCRPLQLSPATSPPRPDMKSRGNWATFFSLFCIATLDPLTNNNYGN